MSNSHRDAEAVPCEDYGLAIDRDGDTPSIATDTSWRPESRMQELAQTIETAVIPRLLLAHRSVDLRKAIVVGTALGAGSVEAFVKRLMSHDSSEAGDYIDDLILRGMPMEVVLLDLMAPAARRLGEMWSADLCDFVDVTLGLSRMQQMLRKFNGMEGDTRSGVGHSVLLVPAPGEQHTFGLRIVEEFLLRDGWEVRCNLKATLAETVNFVADGYYDVVGFTLSGEVLLHALISAVAEVRRASQNRTIRVMVGGVIFSEHPELLAQVGADAIVLDAKEAVRQANQWAGAARLN